MKRISAIALALLMAVLLALPAFAAPENQAADAEDSPISVEVQVNDQPYEEGQNIDANDKISFKVSLAPTALATKYDGKVNITGLRGIQGNPALDILLDTNNRDETYTYTYTVDAQDPTDISFTIDNSRVWRQIPGQLTWEGKVGEVPDTHPIGAEGYVTIKPTITPSSNGSSTAPQGLQAGDTVEFNLGLNDIPNVEEFTGTVTTTGLTSDTSASRTSLQTVDLTQNDPIEVLTYLVADPDTPSESPTNPGDSEDTPSGTESATKATLAEVDRVSFTLQNQQVAFACDPYVWKSAVSYGVTTTQPTGGKISIISPAGNPTEIGAGETVTVQATPEAGYKFGSWQITSGGNAVTATPDPDVANQASFTMPAGSVKVSATFVKREQYAINIAWPVANGNLSVQSSIPPTDGTFAALEGETVSLTPIPDRGYALVALSVTGKNGNSIQTTAGANGTYTFTMPAEAVTVSVQFAATSESTPTPTPNPSETATSTLTPTPTSVRTLPPMPPFPPATVATATPVPTATPAPTPTAEPTPTPTPVVTPAPTLQPNGLPSGITVAADSPINFVRDGRNMLLTGFELHRRGNQVTAGDLADNFVVEQGADYQVIDQDGNPVPDSTPLATGFLIEFEQDGEIVSGATIVIQGDVMGTGQMSLTQVARVASAYSGTEPLYGAYLEAGDFLGSGRITLTDVVREAAMYRRLVLQ